MTTEEYVELIWQERAVLRTRKAIDFLSPHLGVSPPSNSWLRYRFPEVSVGQLPSLFGGRGVYNPKENRMTIGKDYIETSTVSHEVGHWWHSMINPALLGVWNRLGYIRGDTLNSPRRPISVLSEIIALKCQDLAEGKENGLDVLGLSLGDLARVNLHYITSNGGRLEETYTALHRLRYPESYKELN
ncbi:MAG TPA: hypothetical protein ENH99_02045 [Candidatus Pacearchaeota archaeon]|nr:hypothetical protein [Candidatus Pacearchaeota archaeon]